MRERARRVLLPVGKGSMDSRRYSECDHAIWDVAHDHSARPHSHANPDAHSWNHRCAETKMAERPQTGGSAHRSVGRNGGEIADLDIVFDYRRGVHDNTSADPGFGVDRRLGHHNRTGTYAGRPGNGGSRMHCCDQLCAPLQTLFE